MMRPTEVPRSLNRTPSGPRAGVTLSEVLVSTLIMSIGIVSVATLFPIAVLRSIQASQLTHAVLLRQNAEALLEYDSNVIHDPDRNGNEREHRADIDLNLDGDVADTGENGWSKDWLGDNIPDSGAYLIDPLGMASVSAANQNQLGLLPRFSGFGTAIPTAVQAESVCMLPDSWETVFETTAVSIDTTNFRVVVPSSQDWTNLSTATVRNSNAGNLNNPRYRMVLTDQSTGKSAVTKDVYQIDTTNNYLIWQDPNAASATALPTWFPTTGAIGVRLEVQERRYTWMLTVRKNATGTTAVDVVTFFGRSFRNQDEFVYGVDANASTSVTYSVNTQTGQATGNGYDGQPGVEGVDDDQDGTTDEADEQGWPGSDDKRTLTVTWGSSDPTPFLKSGGYVLDVSAGHWYRIVQYTQGTTSASIVVDRDLTTLPSNITPRVVFFRGVIEIYPLGMRMAP